MLPAAALALFARSLGNGFTNWDDPRYVEANGFARQGLAGLLEAFTHPFDGAYYPLTHACYVVLRRLFGTSPLSYHALQIALFAAAVALLPRALRTFGVPLRVGFWVALLFCVHPLRVESVSWAANLKDAGSLLGVVGSFALLGSGRRWTAAVAFLAAMLFKSTVFPLALLVPLLERRDGRSWLQASARALPWLVPAAAVAVAGGVFHLGGADAAARAPVGGSVLAALPTATGLPFWHLGRMLLPVGLHALYPVRALAWFEPLHLLALALWAGWLALVATRPADRRFAWLLGTAGFVLPLLPVVGVVPLAFPGANRYALLPSVAVGVGGVMLLERLVARMPAGRWVAAGALGTAALVLATASFVRQAAWRDGVTLWEPDREAFPEQWAVRVNLAGAYGGAGRWSEAVEELRAAERLRPEDHKPSRELVFALLARDRVPVERILFYQGLLQQFAEDGEKLAFTSGALFVEGQPEAAEKVLELAERHRAPAEVVAALRELGRAFSLAKTDRDGALALVTRLEGRLPAQLLASVRRRFAGP